MELVEFYERIGLQAEIVQKLRGIREKIDWTEFDSCLKQLMDEKTAASAYENLKTQLGEDEECIKMLCCQLECARRAFAGYQEKQIPDTIYMDTMKCFPRFLEECRKKTGRMFFDRGWWTYRQVSMQLFRIGALEFQFQTYAGENVIALHIPSDVDFSKEAVDASLEQAGKFFRTHYRHYHYEKYTCNSWLMSPVIQMLLPETSNIRSFQSRFDIVQVHKDDTEYIGWLFQVPADTEYKDFPAKTSLQKKVRELLLHGGAVGSAYGVMKARRG